RERRRRRREQPEREPERKPALGVLHGRWDSTAARGEKVVWSPARCAGAAPARRFRIGIRARALARLRPPRWRRPPPTRSPRRAPPTTRSPTPPPRPPRPPPPPRRPPTRGSAAGAPAGAAAGGAWRRGRRSPG